MLSDAVRVGKFGSAGAMTFRGLPANQGAEVALPRRIFFPQKSGAFESLEEKSTPRREFDRLFTRCGGRLDQVTKLLEAIAPREPGALKMAAQSFFNLAYTASVWYQMRGLFGKGERRHSGGPRGFADT